MAGGRIIATAPAAPVAALPQLAAADPPGLATAPIEPERPSARYNWRRRCPPRFSAAGETGMRCRTEPPCESRGCPRNGKPFEGRPRRHCRRCFVLRWREGWTVRMASPETGLHPAMARATKRARSGRRQRDAGRRRRRPPVRGRASRAFPCANPSSLRALARSSASHPDPRRAGMHGQRGDVPCRSTPQARARRLAFARRSRSRREARAGPPHSRPLSSVWSPLVRHRGRARRRRRASRRSTPSSSPRAAPRSRCSSSSPTSR